MYLQFGLREIVRHFIFFLFETAFFVKRNVFVRTIQNNFVATLALGNVYELINDSAFLRRRVSLPLSQVLSSVSSINYYIFDMSCLKNFKNKTERSPFRRNEQFSFQQTKWQIRWFLILLCLRWLLQSKHLLHSSNLEIVIRIVPWKLFQLQLIGPKCCKILKH